jgi:hypothetical protein
MDDIERVDLDDEGLVDELDMEFVVDDDGEDMDFVVDDLDVDDLDVDDMDWGEEERAMVDEVTEDLAEWIEEFSDEEDFEDEDDDDAVLDDVGY